MDRDEANKLLKGGQHGIAEWNRRRAEDEPIPDLTAMDLSRADLTGVDLSSTNLSRANLNQAILHEANLDHSLLREASLDTTNLQGATLADCDMRGARFAPNEAQGMKARHAVFDGANLSGAHLAQSVLEFASFDKVNLQRTDFGSCELKRASFRQCDAQQARFSGAKCDGARFLDVNCRDARFEATQLRKASFRGVTVNAQTNFQLAQVEGCTIDRHTLESLENYGGLTVGDRMGMLIVDDVATMRFSFGGFKGIIHSIALMIFAAPYLWFIGRCWYIAEFRSGDLGESVTIITALLRFIWSGGEGWQHGWTLSWYPFLLFALALFYNALRFALLWKTKTLEHQQSVSGLHVRFSLVRVWRILYELGRYGFYGNLLVVFLHTLHFLTQRFSIAAW